MAKSGGKGGDFLHFKVSLQEEMKTSAPLQQASLYVTLYKKVFPLSCKACKASFRYCLTFSFVVMQAGTGLPSCQPYGLYSSSG